jgi:hypothetical protein
MVTALEAMGSTPITMPIADVYESLRTGVLDGFLGTLAVIGDFKFEEVAPYLTYFPYYNATFYIIINTISGTTSPPTSRRSSSARSPKPGRRRSAIIRDVSGITPTTLRAGRGLKRSTS